MLGLKAVVYVLFVFKGCFNITVGLHVAIIRFYMIL